ncbi:unnamed protein product [Pleuronectes platessa]|uniref:Uncharacterized protein n=1 Tax=Pleuronectes platessa TaxID=8262 RepID=A0A9N7V315_PLEPL|nr:unnamed protein product [Pleuronectes platessa]
MEEGQMKERERTEEGERKERERRDEELRITSFIHIGVSAYRRQFSHPEPIRASRRDQEEERRLRSGDREDELLRNKVNRSGGFNERQDNRHEILSDDVEGGDFSTCKSTAGGGGGS